MDKSEVKIARSLQGTTSRLGDELLIRMLDPRHSALDPRWLRKRCNAMVTHGSLEGLAILTICLRLASKYGADGLTMTFYRHATKCLLIFGGMFYAHGIAQAIAEFYEKILLPKCCCDYQFGTFDAHNYLYTVGRLIRSALATQEEIGKSLIHQEAIPIMLRAL